MDVSLYISSRVGILDTTMRYDLPKSLLPVQKGKETRQLVKPDSRVEMLPVRHTYIDLPYHLSIFLSNLPHGPRNKTASESTKLTTDY